MGMTQWPFFCLRTLTLISTSFWGGETPLAADTSMRRKAPPVGVKDGADRTAGPPAPTPSVSVLYWISKAGRAGRPLDTAAAEGGRLAEVVCCCCCCCCWWCGAVESRGAAELSRRSGSDSGEKWQRWPFYSSFAVKSRGTRENIHYTNRIGLTWPLLFWPTLLIHWLMVKRMKIKGLFDGKGKRKVIWKIKLNSYSASLRYLG